MKVKMFHLFPAVCAAFILAALPLRAELGLAGKPPKAVGALVKNTAATIYVSGADSETIKNQIIAILNEAAATGDEETVRYAIVGVMMGGSIANLDLSKEAISGSAVFSQYPELAENTMMEAEALMTGREPEARKRALAEKRPETPGKSEGYGPRNPFENPPPRGGPDGDLPVTPT